MLRVLRPSRRVYLIVAFVTDWMLIIETITLVINQKKNTKKETNSRNYYILCFYILWRKVITFCITLLLHFVVKFITFCVNITFCVSYYVLWRYTPAYNLMDFNTQSPHEAKQFPRTCAVMENWTILEGGQQKSGP